MNKDQMQGKWKELKGSVKERWGKLTDNDLVEIDGRRERLAGVLQQRYGLAKEQVEQQIAEFEKNCKC